MYEKVWVNFPFLRVRSWTVLVQDSGALQVTFRKDKIVVHYNLNEIWIEFKLPKARRVRRVRRLDGS